MRLRINQNKDGTKNYYILESYRTDAGKSTTRIVRKLGTHDELLKEHADPEAWAQSVVEKMNRAAQDGKQQIMVPYRPMEQIVMDEQRLYDGGYLFLQKLFYQSRLDYICKKISGRYDFSFRETKTKEVLDDVADLRSEVGIISFSGSNEGLLKKLFRDLQLEFVPLMKRDTYIYVWKDHPLAGEKMLSLDDMKGWPCVSFDQSGDGNFYITEEAMADYPFDRTIRSGDRATTMEIIAELGGFSVGSGMLAEKGSVLSGMVAIKMKEDDPLTIGYITRVGRALSHYGEEYVKELQRYKEL